MEESPESRAGRPSNLESLWLYGTLFFINCVAFFFYIRTPPLAGDYAAFYSATTAFRTNPSQLYDPAYQLAIHIFPFFHVPHELIFYLFFSFLPFFKSLFAWRVFCFACLAASGWLLGRCMQISVSRAIAICFTMFAVQVCVNSGQDSIVLLLLVAAAYYLLDRDADAFAGIVLAVALFKPQLPITLAVGLLALRRMRAFWTFCIAGTVIAAGSLVFVGRKGIEGILRVTQLGENNVLRISLMPTFRGLLARIIGDHHVVTAVVAVLLLGFAYRVWRKGSLEFVFASACCLFCFSALHLYSHDLVVLAFPLLVVSRSERERWDPLLLIIFLSAPLFIMLFRYNFVGLLSLAVAWLAARCWRVAERTDSRASAQ